MSKLFKLLRRVPIATIGASLSLVDTIREFWGRTSSLEYLRASRLYPAYLRQGNAAAFCRAHAEKFCKGQGLDIGAGQWPFPGARAIEFRADENAFVIREANNTQDFIFSSHCLEHLSNWRDALREWIRVLKPGGIIYLYLPHSVCLMWQVGVNPFHEWQPEPSIIQAELEGLGLTILECSTIPDGYLSFHVVARKGSQVV